MADLLLTHCLQFVFVALAVIVFMAAATLCGRNITAKFHE